MRHYGIYPEVCQIKDGAVLSELVSEFIFGETMYQDKNNS